jgi:hypothetical protein
MQRQKLIFTSNSINKNFSPFFQDLENSVWSRIKLLQIWLSLSKFKKPIRAHMLASSLFQLAHHLLTPTVRHRCPNACARSCADSSGLQGEPFPSCHPPPLLLVPTRELRRVGSVMWQTEISKMVNPSVSVKDRAVVAPLEQVLNVLITYWR